MQFRQIGSILSLVLMVVGQASVAVAQPIPEYTDTPHVSDPRFPLKTYPDNHSLNDNTPWQTKVVPFDPRRTYTASEQDQIIASEAQIFQTVAPPRPPPAWGVTPERELNITHPSYPQATTNSVVLDTLQLPLLQTPEAQAGGNTSFNWAREQRFGNNLFGSRYYTRSTVSNVEANRAWIESNNRFYATLFNTTRDVARFFVRAECNCIGPVPSRDLTADVYVMGQRRTRIVRGASFAIQRPIWRQDRLDFFLARKVFMVGPVPMTVTATVTGNARLDLGATLSCEGVPEVVVEVEPSVGLEVRVAWSLNVIIIQAGVEGRLDLIRVRLPITLTAAIGSSQIWCPTWSALARQELTTIGGSIKLFTIVRFLFFRQRYNLTIARWNGVTFNENTLVNRSGSVCQSTTPLAEL